MKLRGRKKAVAVCRVPPTRRLSRRMMPVAPMVMEGSENTKPLAGTCNLPSIAKKKMTKPEVELVDLTGMEPTWEKTNHKDWWQTSTSLTSHSSPPIQRKELQENVNLQMNGMTRPQSQFKDAEKPVVQLYVCFFCERNFENKEMLQTHQKICTLRPAHLQDLCTPIKQSRPRVNISDPRKNMYVTSLGLLPVEKAKHMELAHRIRRDSQIDCDLIEVDQTPLITPRTPTTPRTPKSLISFNTPSISKQQEVCLVSSDDESDAGSSDGSLLGRQDYICQAPLMTIDFSSPLGVRIKGHIKQVNKPNITDYEKFCRTPVKNRFKERLRERDSFAAVTFKHKRHFRKFYHTYRFCKDDSREFMEHLETGLNRQSRERLKRMKPCHVVLKRLTKHLNGLNTKKTNVCPSPPSPEETERCSRSSSPDSLPDLSCTFPATPVVKCYDLKSLLGATPSRLAVLDKNSEEVDEHTRNRVIVYKAILADAMQDPEGESCPSQPSGQFVAMRSLLRRGNPNPLPTSQQTRAKLAMEGTDDDWVFSNCPGMESQPKEKPQEKKAEYVPQMLSSLSPDKSAPKNSTYQTSQQQQSRQNIPRSRSGLSSQQFPPYRSNAIPSQSRQVELSNKPVPSYQSSHNVSAQSVSNNNLVRRSGRTRHIEKKIDDEISIMVPVCDDTSPTSNAAPLASRAKRPMMGSEMSGPSPKMPRLDHGRQRVNAVQPRQVVKRLSFDNPGMNHTKPLASVQPTRSTQNNVAMNPRINLGTRQAHNINLANHASPRNDFAKTNNHGLRRGSNAGVNRSDINTDNLPKLGVHESGKVEDNNFLFKCHLCGLEEQYSVNATTKIYNHLHTVHKEEVIHIVDYNTQGEVHLVEAMGQPPTMIRTSNFSKPSDHVESGHRSTTNPPAYYGISSEPTLGQGPPNTDCISSVPSVEGAWYNNMKSKSYTNDNNISPRHVPQMRGKVSPQYSLRPKTPPKSYSQVTPPKSFGQPTPPTTPQSQNHQSVLSRRSVPRMNFSWTKSSLSGTKFSHSGTRSNFSGTRSNFSGTKPNFSGAKSNFSGSRSFIVDDDDVVCLDDDVICIS